ncbi:MAG: ClpX C4-type zinc finger protein [Actinomycetota bacterium]
MAIDPRLTQEAREARRELIDLEYEAERARLRFQHAVRRMHAGGGSLREIAEALGVSHQRVHQIVDGGAGKTALKPSRPQQCCSFCGRSRAESLTLVAGPGVFICNRCVGAATNVSQHAAGDAEVRLARIPDHARDRCSFCGKRRRQVETMVGSPGTPRGGTLRQKYPGAGIRVCSDCLGLCREIVDEAAAP